MKFKYKNLNAIVGLSAKSAPIPLLTVSNDSKIPPLAGGALPGRGRLTTSSGLTLDPTLYLSGVSFKNRDQAACVLLLRTK